MSRPTWY